MRLIDADSLMKKFDPNDVKLLDTIAVRYRIATEETVQPQKVGKWIKDEHGYQYKWVCSNCQLHHRAMYNFCPSCGAKMEEGE